MAIETSDLVQASCIVNMNDATFISMMGFKSATKLGVGQVRLMLQQPIPIGQISGMGGITGRDGPHPIILNVKGVIDPTDFSMIGLDVETWDAVTMTLIDDGGPTLTVLRLPVPYPFR